MPEEEIENNQENNNSEESTVSETESQDNTDIDSRLQKSVGMLKTLAKIDDEKLKGLSLEEQFDRLTFYLDNQPKKKKSKNKPVVGMPLDSDAPSIGRTAKEGNSKIWYFKPNEWIIPTKKE